MMETLIYLLKPCYETLYLTLVPLAASFVLGLILGLVIFMTSSNSPYKKRNKFTKFLSFIVDGICNILRSIPYIILLILLIPLSKLLTGTMLGVNGALLSLIVSATPFVARMCVIAFIEVDKKTTEALISMGATWKDLVFKLYLKEALPALVSAITVTGISLVGYSTMAGAIGSGGLGFAAYNEGFVRNKPAILYFATILLVVIVFIIQFTGDYISKKIDKR